MNNDDNEVYLEVHEDSKGSEDIKSNVELTEHNNLYEKPCALCQVLTTLDLKYYTVKRTLNTLCQQCYQLIQNSLPFMYQDELKLPYTNTTIICNDNFRPYDVQLGNCTICLEDTILWNLGECNHECCVTCLQAYINTKLADPLLMYRIICPIANCYHKLDDYFIAQVVSSECLNFLVKPCMQCYKMCPNILEVIPYGNLKSTSITITNDKVNCNHCKSQFCSRCWTKHKGNCDYDRLFRNNYEQLGLLQCPGCNYIAIGQSCNPLHQVGPCRYYQVQNQQCPICFTEFCLECHGPMDIYETLNNASGYTCRKCKAQHDTLYNLVKRCLSSSSWRDTLTIILYVTLVAAAIFLTLGAIIVLLSYLAIKQLIEVTDKVFQLFKETFAQRNKYVLILVSPLLLILMLVIVVFVYIVTFVPLMYVNIQRLFQ